MATGPSLAGGMRLLYWTDWTSDGRPVTAVSDERAVMAGPAWSSSAAVEPPGTGYLVVMMMTSR